MNDSEFKINNNNLEEFKLSSDNNDSSSGRVKGSIKDRIISFLYRKRLKIKLIKRNILTKKETKISFFKKYSKKNVKKNINVIKDYRDLKNSGKKIIDVDLKTEIFDFEKYDYYIIEPVKKKGIDEETLKTVNSHKKVIQGSKKIIESIDKNITKIAINLKYPKEHQENLSSTYLNVKEDIIHLKEEIAKLPRKINTDDLEKIVLKDDDESLIEARRIVDDYQIKLDEYYKDLKVVETINKVQLKNNVGIDKKNKENNVMNKVNTNKEKKSNINDGNIKLNKVNKKKIVNKKIAIDKREKAINAFNMKKIQMIKNTNIKLKDEINVTKEAVLKMNKEVSKVTKEITEVTKVTGYARMIKSCLSVATGILTLPFSKVNIFNITLGSALINKGLKGLRKGLETKSEIKIDYKYEDLSNKIKATKDKAKLAELLITDSLDQINMIKKDVSYIDSESLESLMKLEKNLLEKLNEIKGINNKLTKQEEKNKIKLKKVEKKEY